MNTCMRVYTNVDVQGVELCGALKNVIALAAGISKGLGYGDMPRQHSLREVWRKYPDWELPWDAWNRHLMVLQVLAI